MPLQIKLPGTVLTSSSWYETVTDQWNTGKEAGFLSRIPVIAKLPFSSCGRWEQPDQEK
jgi:hypothetical protein